MKREVKINGSEWARRRVVSGSPVLESDRVAAMSESGMLIGRKRMEELSGMI